MPDLLLELFSEEIPSRMQRKAADDLRAAVTNALVEAGLTYEGAKEYWTPRRLMLDVRGLTARSADIKEERKGPRTDAPEKALEGFMRGAGLSSIDDAEVRNDAKKGDFYVAVIEKPGRDATDIIADIMPGIIKGFAWPKSMRWGESSGDVGSLKWVRPLQSILCLFGPETEEMDVVEFEVDGIKSGNVSRGHRFMAPADFEVKHFDDYAAKLQNAHVILDAETRKETILTEAKNLAFAQGLELVDDPVLLEEVSGLVEWPVPLMGEYEEDFLDIPAEVIQLTIRENQKCFVLAKPNSHPHPEPVEGQGEVSQLTNKFMLVSNITPSDGGAEVIRGNGKVVNARLSDAKFFWESDLHQINSDEGFEPWIKKLDTVTFHAKLGTQGERVNRIVALAEELAPSVAKQSPHPEPVKGRGGSDGALTLRQAQGEGEFFAQVREAARLCKADLNSAMVTEFAKVQGKMGAIYAEKSGKDASVALAIQEHYSPLGPTDDVPSDPVSVTVALADKLDMLVGFWAIDEKPTGKGDPFALRRAALGVIRLVLENGLRLNLFSLFLAAVSKNNVEVYQPTEIESDTVGRVISPANDLLSFFHDRLKVYLRDKGIRHDLIDAVLSQSPHPELVEGKRPHHLALRQAQDEGIGSTPHRSNKAEALQKLIDSEDGQNLLAGYKRAANILAAEEKKGTNIAESVSADLLADDAEKALNTAIDKTVECNDAALANENFEGAMTALASLRTPIDKFFELHIMDDDEKVRANRLAMLVRIRSAMHDVADFSKISG